jgi:type VI secretion system secreted protein Hcp
MEQTMNKIVTYAAVLIVGILIGSLAFYTWTQISPPEAPRNTAYTQYGESNTMNYRAFLKVADVPGLSLDAQHPDEIEILEYGWGETMDAGAIFEARGAAGPAKEDFTFVFWWDDKASSKLFQLCTKGEIVGEALFSVRSSGMPTDFLVVHLEQVVVSSFQTQGNVFEGEKPLCEIHLAFNVILMQTFRLSATGAVLDGAEFRWNYAKNSET